MLELIQYLDSSYLLPFLLLFARILSFFALMPVVGATYLSSKIRVMIAFYLTIFLYPNIQNSSYINEDNFIQLLINEIMLGIATSMILHLVFAGVKVIGELISYATALSMSSQLDPTSGTKQTSISNLLNIIATLVFLETGMYEAVLMLLANSLDSIHLGSFNIYDYNGISLATSELTRMMLFAFSFSFPLFFIGTIMDIFFGYSTRNTPSFSVFVITFQLKFMLIFGFLILGISIFIDNFKEYFFQTVY